MKKLTTALCAGLAISVLGACSSTDLLTHWSDPDFVKTPLHHIAVFSRNKDIGTARAVEQGMAQKLSAITQATPAYALFGDTDITTLPKKQVQQTLNSKGIDGLLMIGVTRSTMTEKYVPPAYPDGFWSDSWGGWNGWGEWGYAGWGDVTIVPGYSYVSTSTYVQAALYEVAHGKLVWTAQTRTTDPSELENVRKEIDGLMDRNLLQAQVVTR